jgi:hypothetical protein
MCELVVQTTDNLWKLYKDYVGSARRKYGEVVRETFDVALAPLGYRRLRHHDDSGSLTVTYAKGTATLIVYYIGEGFIHGSLYLAGAEGKETDVGLWSGKDKPDPLSVDDFVAILVEKEKEFNL